MVLLLSNFNKMKLKKKSPAKSGLFLICAAGFTLVEVLIVLVIFGILSLLPMQYLLRARRNTNEAAAIASLRTISSAFESYRAAQTPPAYPSLGADLSGATPPYIDSILANALDGANAKQGYDYAITLSNQNSFIIDATPDEVGLTGAREFQITEEGVITLSDGTPVE